MRKTLLAILLFATSALAADLTGNWSGEGVNNGETHPLYFVLKQDGNALSGTVGPDAGRQLPFKDGKVDGNKIVFEVTGGKGVMHFELQADGDAMKGTIEFRSDEGTQSATVNLKRATT